MTAAARHAIPRARHVLLAQVRTVGSAHRRPGILVTALGASAILLVSQFVTHGDAIEFHPHREELFGILGLLAPIGLWMEEDRFGPGFLWTFPVDRRWHALAKVFAGWLWLMGTVTLFVLSLLAFTLLSGGNVMHEESIRLVSVASFPAGATIDAGVISPIGLTPEPLFWLVPFTAATGTYLLASALILGTRHPLICLVGTMLALYVAVGVSEEANMRWLATAPGRVVQGLFDGPYGLDALLTARTGSLKTEVVLATGERVLVWRALPDVRQWITATLLWTGAGLVLVWFAASRHRERRRA